MKTTNEPQPAFAITQFIKANPALVDIANRHGLRIEERTLPGFFSLDVEFMKDCRDKENAKRILAGFEDWSTNDPAGIAAMQADEDHAAWKEAEKQRKEMEEIKERLREKLESDDEDMVKTIGSSVAELDPQHPDIDKEAVASFLGWFRSSYPVRNPPNAILSGPSGTGKTRALAQAAKFCCGDGRENVEWITGYQFAELVSDLATDRRTEARDHLNQITQAWWLFIDDLGSVNFTPARTSRFYQLVDERYRRGLETFISTNYTTSQLKKLFATTGETRDEATRILRRIIGTPTAPLAKFFHFKRPTKTAENTREDEALS